MLRNLFVSGLGLSMLVGASACQYNKEGVFIAFIPADNALECDTTISENITDSDPPDTIAGTTDWTYSETDVSSDAVVFIQIFEDKGGNILIDISGSIYVGTSDGGVITASWTNQVDSNETISHVDGYSYSESDVTTVVQTVTLTQNKDTKGYSGVWATTVTSKVSGTEQDEWDMTVGPYAGDINNFIFSYLYGSGSNSPDMVDCDSNPCFVEVTNNCSGSFNFEVRETDLEPEAYEGIKNSGQPSGVY